MFYSFFTFVILFWWEVKRDWLLQATCSFANGWELIKTIKIFFICSIRSKNNQSMAISQRVVFIVFILLVVVSISHGSLFSNLIEKNDNRVANSLKSLSKVLEKTPDFSFTSTSINKLADRIITEENGMEKESDRLALEILQNLSLFEGNIARDAESIINELLKKGTKDFKQFEKLFTLLLTHMVDFDYHLQKEIIDVINQFRENNLMSELKEFVKISKMDKNYAILVVIVTCISLIFINRENIFIINFIYWIFLMLFLFYYLSELHTTKEQITELEIQFTETLTEQHQITLALLADLTKKFTNEVEIINCVQGKIIDYAQENLQREITLLKENLVEEFTRENEIIREELLTIEVNSIKIGQDILNLQIAGKDLLMDTIEHVDATIRNIIIEKEIGLKEGLKNVNENVGQLTEINGKNRLPIGTVHAYFGKLEEIPVDWAICDGKNGTPDLANKFLRGTLGKVNEQGGNDFVTLSLDQMPIHNHDYVDTYYSERYCENKENGQHLGSGNSDRDNFDCNYKRTTSTAGGNKPFRILPSYITTIYIMKIR